MPAAWRSTQPYVDCAVRRYQAYTGETAILDETGQTFAEVAAARGSSVPSAQPVQTTVTQADTSRGRSDKPAEVEEPRQ